MCAFDKINLCLLNRGAGGTLPEQSSVCAPDNVKKTFPPAPLMTVTLTTTPLLVTIWIWLIVSLWRNATALIICCSVSPGLQKCVERAKCKREHLRHFIIPLWDRVLKVTYILSSGQWQFPAVNCTLPSDVNLKGSTEQGLCLDQIW